MSSTSKDKIATLSEYRELKEMISIASKRINEIKEEIQERYQPGEYGHLILTIETREVKGYIVPPRVDRIIRVVAR